MVMLAKAEFPDSSLPNSPWSKTAGKDLLLICSPMPFIHSYISWLKGRGMVRGVPALGWFASALNKAWLMRLVCNIH